MKIVADMDKKLKDLEYWRYCDDDCYRCERKKDCEIAKKYREKEEK